MTDLSTVDSMSVAAAASIATSSDDTSSSFSITESMLSHLRMEADYADDKARRLRKQAAEIAKQFGITEESQQAFDFDPAELPPLDEKGLPKYKGKKRGRKPKAKKRKTKPDRPKRKHTGYTLFMQEVYPAAKAEYPDHPSKELISLIARRWKDLEIDVRTAWKERARQATDNLERKAHINADNNRNIDHTNTAASTTNYLYLTSKDDNNVEIRAAGDTPKDYIGTGVGTISKPLSEENGEEEEEVPDEDIDGDMAEH